MRLDFNVLCIDDHPDNVKSAIESLGDHIEQEGFRLHVQYSKSLENAFSVINDDLWSDGIDLVLVDYDLGSGSGGDRALTRIKNAMPYKEVVFYSAVSTADLRKLAYEAGVEGVYCANRLSLGETITGVFDALVKKVLDIDHCRGIVLGATSDVDHLVNNILQTVDAQLSEDQRIEWLQFALARIDETISRSQLAREKLAAGGTMEMLLAEHQLFTSYDRLRLLIAVHDLRFNKTQSALRKAIGRYAERIVKVRNVLGHLHLIPGQPHAALRSFGGEKVEPDTLREVRKELIQFRDQFHRLAELVSGGDAGPEE
jgi:CheY-like chemotaxis protein